MSEETRYAPFGLTLDEIDEIHSHFMAIPPLTAHIRQLLAERSETALELLALHGQADEALQRVKELEAENADLKGDALRFRWDQQCSHFFESQVLNKLYDRKNACDWPTLDECRAAYDAAIEASEGCMDA